MNMRKIIPIYQYCRYEIFNQESISEYRYSDYIGLLCPECYHYHIIEAISTQILGRIKTDTQRDPEDNIFDLIVIPDQILRWTCPECKSRVYQEDHIDPNIVPIIALLNKKGFETEYCCEGHDCQTKPGHDNIFKNEVYLEDSTDNLDEEGIQYSHPYIKFKTTRMKYITDLLPLVHPWVRCNEEINRISFQIEVEQVRLPKRETMGSLLLWAYYLPDISKIIENPEELNSAIEKAMPVYDWMQANPDKVTRIIDALYKDGIDVLDKECYDIAYKPYEYMPKVEFFYD